MTRLRSSKKGHVTEPGWSGSKLPQVEKAKINKKSRKFLFLRVWMNKWSQSCSCFLVTCAQPFIHVPWGSNSRRGNPQPLWLTGSSWWEGWGSAWSHRIEANPFWFAEDSIYRWHQCLWFSCFGSLATFTILAACEKDLERLGGGEGEILPVWSDSQYIYICIYTQYLYIYMQYMYNIYICIIYI